MGSNKRKQIAKRGAQSRKAHAQRAAAEADKHPCTPRPSLPWRRAPLPPTGLRALIERLF
jgi:hypothetical protein